MLTLRPAGSDDFAFCESLSRENMASYRAVRAIPWDPQRFLASWTQFENLVIFDGEARVGTMRLFAFDDVLEIRDLQVVPAHRGRGIGRWAVTRAKELGADRGARELGLRVYPENPARALYLREGFTSDRVSDGVEHMTFVLPARPVRPGGGTR